MYLLFVSKNTSKRKVVRALIGRKRGEKEKEEEKQYTFLEIESQ
jgi:hypothetical protein